MLLGTTAWAVLLGLYLLFAGEVSRTELLAGVPASGIVAAFVVLLRGVEGRRLRLAGPWWRIVGRPLAALVPGAVRVGGVLLRALWRRPAGAVGVATAQPFRVGGGNPDDAGRRGLVTLGASLAPNGYVLDVPPEGDALLLHRLVPMPPDPDREWPL